MLVVECLTLKQTKLGDLLDNRTSSAPQSSHTSGPDHPVTCAPAPPADSTGTWPGGELCAIAGTVTSREEPDSIFKNKAFPVLVS